RHCCGRRSAARVVACGDAGNPADHARQALCIACRSVGILAMSAPDWPSGLLLAYYGDDFTGSTDAMEAMTAAGVPTVLFLEPPARALLERFPGVRCVGLAGSSRGRSPEWMRAHLPAAFASLAALGAP